MKKVHNLRRVFVWELPVRIFHWVNALAIVVLCVTGYLIGDPPAFVSHNEASYQYTFGFIRFIHFTAAYVFIANFIFRVYWGFVGNKYAHWRNFVPTSKKFIQGIFDVLRIDIMLAKNKRHVSIGHNPLAGFIYFLTFIAFLVQVVTGFGLYASMTEWWLPDMFGWVSPFLGGEFATRQIHHIAMWFFIVFAVIHVYLVFYHDYVDGHGEISSMGGGWKFIDEELFEEMEEEERTKKEEVGA
jgi:Ni/Fe-hydrogenase 1 B-type cytochrome subunit